MDKTSLIWMIGMLLGGGCGAWLALRARQHPENDTRDPSQAVAQAAPATRAEAGAEGGADAGAQALTESQHHYYCAAFSVQRFDYTIRDAHQEVMSEVKRALKTVTTQDGLLPRKPMLIPELLRALNDTTSTRSELSGIIHEDPVLAGDVLKFANSPYYRVAREPVDSIDRAIVLLGTEGLKSVVASSILQPVFRIPKGHFDAFATTLWDFAMRTATAAGVYAASSRSADPATARLLGLLSALGPLALFRLTGDIYRRRGDVMPRAEVFIKLIDSEGAATSSAIATHWNLPESFASALLLAGDPDEAEDPLARALQVGRWAALLAMASARNKIDAASGREALRFAGVPAQTTTAVWSSVTTSDRPESVPA